MNDYISRQALLRDIEKYHLSDGKFQHWVEAQPSVEAEPVVRCKDCVNCEYDSIFNQYWCGGSEVISDGFCNYGEREDPLQGAMNPPEDDITDGKGEAK